MISAVVLAAGSSRRMGEPKMTMPWGNTSILGTVLRILRSSGLNNIVAVAGAARDSVEHICSDAGVPSIFNVMHEEGEMLSSLQVGLRALGSKINAALIVLGDQPRIEESTIRRIIQAHQDKGALLVVPSFRRRRGHPWLISRVLWKELLDLQSPATPRDFLNLQAAYIEYVEIDTPSILEDIDTQDDYLKSRP